MDGSTQAAFATDAGISQAGIHKLLHGGEPNLGTLIALAKAGGVSVEWLATGRGNRILADEEASALTASLTTHLNEFAFVPRYEVSASAGHGLRPISEDISERVAFRADWLREIGVSAANAAVLTADGDSMEPLIPDGALMLVDVSIREVRNGCIYVIVKDGDLLVKRVHRKVDGTVSLISENVRYDPEIISADMLDKLHIVGRVRWVGRTI
ncbi:helix-turn-helix transcriptional regulator [Kaistia algarum]|nr:helix-turn-helix transcriptional regulator [Kaistia algarum]